MNEKETKEGLYRQNVSAIIVDDDREFLLEQKVIYNDNEWGWIGGGVEEGEELLDTLFREIEEELGLSRSDFEIIGLSTHDNRYEFDPVFLEKVRAEGSPYIGQVKKVYVLRFVGNRAKIIPDDKIRKLAWVSIDDLQQYLVFEGQYDHAVRVVRELIPDAMRQSS